MLIEGNFQREGSLFHIVALLSREAPRFLVGEDALGAHNDLDQQMLNIGWRLPDFRDLETKPDLIAFSMCGSERMARRQVQAMARWLSKRTVGFQRAAFEIHSYGDVEECLVLSQEWNQPAHAPSHDEENRGERSNVIRLRIE